MANGMGNEMTNVLIYGAGAIGSFVGYLLMAPSQPNGPKIENVALLGRASHMHKIIEAGLQINLQDRSQHLQFKYCFINLNDLKESDFYPELVIICVKTYSLPRVCIELKESRLLQERLKNACFLLLMNGMGSKETFEKLTGLSPSRVLEGITSIGVRFTGDGLIELKGLGKTVIDDKICAKGKQSLKEFLEFRFRESGFEIEFVPDFKKHQWDKLFVNSVVNPITAITGQENGIVLSDQLSGTVQNIIREGVSVAQREGLETDVEGILEVVYSVAEKTSHNTSSMLQDVQKKKMTEIDSINGYIIRLARRYDIEVPVNEALFGLVKSMAG
jgi:2-dehydropantoate 2-reductase